MSVLFFENITSLKKVLILSMLLFCVYAAPAQTLGWQWGVAGNTYHSQGMQVMATTTDAAKNVFIAGYTPGTDSVSFGANTVYNVGRYQQIIVAKTDSSGNFIFADATQKTDAWPINIATDATGNVYLLGMYDSSYCKVGSVILSNPAYNLMYFLVKMSPSGAILWAQNIVGQNTPGIYPESYSGGLGVDASGNVYVAGAFNSDSFVIGVDTVYNNSSIPGTYDVFIASYDSAGNNLWVNSFGDNNNEFAGTMAVTRAGDCYLSGKFYDASLMIGADVVTDSLISLDSAGKYIAKFDNTGNPVWAKGLDINLNVTTAQTDDTGNLYLVGSISSNVVLGSVFLSDTNVHTTDAFVAKFDPIGNVSWAKSSGGPNNETACSISVDTLGNVWICGLMNIGVAYTPTYYDMFFNGMALTEPILGVAPVFAAEYDHEGNYITALALACGGGVGNSCGIVVNNDGGFYFGGSYSKVQMIFGNDTLMHVPVGQAPFVAKYRYAYNLLDTTTPPDSLLKTNVFTAPNRDIHFYPNPANGRFIISTDISFPPEAKAEIFDMEGILVKTISLKGYSADVNTAGFVPGSYLCKVVMKGCNDITGKILINIL